MKKLTIQSSKTIPQVDFDSESGVLDISGRSLPEQAHELFKPMLEWIDIYSKEAKPLTTINITLEYINSSSNKYLLLVLKKLEELQQTGKEVLVNWYYEENDEDAMESGEEYRDLLKVPVNIIKL
jgi:hypothetical protein